jgi:type IV pilus assembly protein PilX
MNINRALEGQMTPANTHRSGPAAVRGIALIVGLVILAVLSLIGVAAFSITTQEERMAGNSRDRMRAFEAAEAALRACENAAATGGIAAFTGTGGMYPAPQSSAAPSVTEGRSESWWQSSANVLQVVDSSGKPFNGNAVAPSCVAEQFSLPNAYWVLGTPFNSTNSVSIARITAHGYGLNRNTVVRLESYYSM